MDDKIRIYKCGQYLAVEATKRDAPSLSLSISLKARKVSRHGHGSELIYIYSQESGTNLY